MQYEVYGPFPVPRIRREIDKTNINGFFEDCDEKTGYELSSAIGVYIFSIQWKGRHVPWYVGQTRNKKGFKAESFTDHKIRYFNEVLADRSGQPKMQFIARVTPETEAFSKAIRSSRAEIDFIEKTVIGLALRANVNIKNVKETKYLKNCRIPGLMGPLSPGRPTSGAAELRRTLKIGIIK